MKHTSRTLLLLTLAACQPPVQQSVQQKVTVAQTQTNIGGGDVQGQQLNLGGNLNKLVFTSNQTQALQLNIGGDDVEITFVVSQKFADALQQLQKGQANEALESLKKLAQAQPDDGEVALNLGNMYLSNGQPKEAIAQYNRILGSFKDPHRLLNNRGLAYQQLNLSEMALHDFNQAIEIAPKDRLAYYLRGNLYSRQGQNAAALASYNQALDIDNRFAAAYHNRGNLKARQNKFDDGQSDLNQAIALDPTNAQIYSNRGLLYLNRNALDLARLDLDRAIALNKKYPDAWINRGILYVRLKDYGNALQDLEQARPLVPPADKIKQAWIEENVAWLQLLKQNWDFALTAANRSLELNPQAEWVKLTVAHVHFLRGNVDQATALYRSLLNKQLDGRLSNDMILADWRLFRSKNLPVPFRSAIEVELSDKLVALPNQGDTQLVLTPMSPIPLRDNAVSPIQPRPTEVTLSTPMLPSSCGFKTQNHDFSIKNSISDQPEIMAVTPGRNASGVDPKSSIVLKFSEPMDKKTVEDTFTVRAYNARQLSVDGANTFTGNSLLNTIENPLVWDKNAFNLSWNCDDTEVTFAFKPGHWLPTDKDTDKIPDYQVVFNDTQGKNGSLLKDKSGIGRANRHFKLTDGPFEESFKFAIKADETPPDVLKVIAETAESGGFYGDSLQVVFSESMIVYTKSRIIAGGLADRIGLAERVGLVAAEKMAPAGHPEATQKATAREAARNYTVVLTPPGALAPTYQGTWYELGGSAYYDPNDASHSTVLLIGPGQADLFQPGTQIQVKVAPTVVDPAGNPVKTTAAFEIVK